MPRFSKILSVLAYCIVVVFGGKGFIYILDSYPSIAVMVGAILLALGALILIGFRVFQEIKK